MIWLAIVMLGSTVALVVARLAIPRRNRLATAMMMLGTLVVLATGAAMLLAVL